MATTNGIVRPRVVEPLGSRTSYRRITLGRVLAALLALAVVAAAVLLMTSLSQLQRSTRAASALIELRSVPDQVVLEADLALLNRDVSSLEEAIETGEVQIESLLAEVGSVLDSDGGDARDDLRDSWEQTVAISRAYAMGGGDFREAEMAAHDVPHQLDLLTAALVEQNEQRLRLLRRAIEVGIAVLLLVAVVFASVVVRERRQLTDLDSLTGLLNRERFRTLLTESLGAASKYAELAVLVIDIDRFRRVNETLGERQGDVVLRDVARRIEAALPREATLARRGADEFLLLLPGVGYARAREVAQRALEGLEQSFVYEFGQVGVTVSIGVAIAPIHGRTAGALIQAAARGRDLAKEEGGNGVRVADMAGSHNDGVLQLEVELREAIQEEQFELFYQPQVDVRSGEILGAEALLRWRSPLRGLVMPDQFISALEQTGLIVPLGDWIVRTAAEQAAEWSTQRTGQFRIAVNVSARQLYHGDLLGTVRQVLDETGLEPKRLEVEVTETVAIQNPERAVSVLESLQELGVHVSLDDFGTGHSWLNQLKQLPAMSLKIDRSFVAGVVDQPQDRAIVAGLIAVAHTLGLGVVAEGVERSDQLAVLEGMQCDLAQGFHFSPAVPAEEFERFLSGQPAWVARREVA